LVLEMCQIQGDTRAIYTTNKGKHQQHKNFTTPIKSAVKRFSRIHRKKLQLIFLEKRVGFTRTSPAYESRCCDRKSRAACAQFFAPWQQATIQIMLAICLTIACSRYVYNGVILHAHAVRGESHNQRNTTGEVATLLVLAQTVVFW